MVPGLDHAFFSFFCDLLRGPVTSTCYSVFQKCFITILTSGIINHNVD